MALQDWLEEIYREQAPALFRFLIRLTGNETETHDLLQEIFIQLAKSPRLLDGIAVPRSYLFRLAHNAYPASLDALVPAYINALPYDVMSGGPYHYRLQPDGTFLLYSIGWNETDESGRVIFEKDKPNSVDYRQGDWVWPTRLAIAK